MRCFSFIIFFSVYIASYSQSNLTKNKHSYFYYTWGYTKAYYSKSTIHFVNTSNKYNAFRGLPDNYDFTINQVTASDRPDFDKIKDVVNNTIPQFVFRIGYMFNDKWGIEMNYDHTKYVVDNWQKTKITGQIDGLQLDKDTVLNPNSFLHFEHTDGANFWMINAVRKFHLYSPSSKFCFSWVLKPGAGIVFPRTDVTIFGQNLNNDWHIAGWIIGVESGLRLEFFKHGFFEFVGKTSYADYLYVFILGKGNGNANHHFFTQQLTATIGLKFGTKKSN